MPEVRDIEVKEKLTPERFKELVRNCAQALENNQEFDVTVAGQTFHIPSEAWTQANKLEVEYEIDEGEYELQLTMKWEMNPPEND
jgi:amphi-Trp domain-containing protein